MDHEIAIASIISDMRDIEDSLQYYAALRHKMQISISNDKVPGRSASQLLPVMTPGDFVKTLKFQ
jgi:hypothetical protein